MSILNNRDITLSVLGQILDVRIWRLKSLWISKEIEMPNGP